MTRSALMKEVHEAARGLIDFSIHMKLKLSRLTAFFKTSEGFFILCCL